MRTLIRELLEARILLVPIKGKVTSYERILWRGLVGHMNEGAIKVSLRPLKRMAHKGQFASVRPHEMARGKYEIRFHRFDGGAPLITMGYIAHEMTHVRQYVRGHLKVEDGFIVWHGKPYMPAREYAAITNYAKYKKLPWEAEAISVQKTLPKQFIRANGPSLRGQDRMLDYMMDNDLL